MGRRAQPRRYGRAQLVREWARARACPGLAPTLGRAPPPPPPGGEMVARLTPLPLDPKRDLSSSPAPLSTRSTQLGTQHLAPVLRADPVLLHASSTAVC